jgi:hypothetical protein
LCTLMIAESCQVLSKQEPENIASSMKYLTVFSVEFPEDAVGTMEKAPNVIGVELTEQPVKTQKD